MFGQIGKRGRILVTQFIMNSRSPAPGTAAGTGNLAQCKKSRKYKHTFQKRFKAHTDSENASNRKRQTIGGTDTLEV